MGMSRMQSGVSCEKLQQVQIICTTLTCCSYIADLSPDFILALAVTVPVLQALPLRDAICKHVAFQSSIRVNITVRLLGPTSTPVNSISFANALNRTSPVDRPSFGWLSICRPSR
jgi:hypothetical protein